MAAQKIVHAPPVHGRGHPRALRTAAPSMMPADPLGKDPGLPPLRARAEGRDQIDPAGPQAPISSDGLEALAPKQLARALDVLDAEPIVASPLPLSEGRASHSQPRMLDELAQKERQVVVIERNVGVQVADDLVLQAPHPSVSRVEGIDLARKVSFRALRPSHELDPIVASGILPHDLIGAVGGTVTHDDPSDRSCRLSDDGSQGVLDVRDFVPRGRYQHTARHSINHRSGVFPSWGDDGGRPRHPQGSCFVGRGSRLRGAEALDGW